MQHVIEEEARKVLERELKRSRLLRQKQVRQQASQWSDETRRKFEDEKGRQVNLMTKALTEEAEEHARARIEHLLMTHDLALAEVGAAHRSAAQIREAEKMKELKRLRGQELADQRGKAALSRVHQDQEQKLQLINQSKERKQNILKEEDKKVKELFRSRKPLSAINSDANQPTLSKLIINPSKNEQNVASKLSYPSKSPTKKTFLKRGEGKKASNAAILKLSGMTTSTSTSAPTGGFEKAVMSRTFSTKIDPKSKPSISSPTGKSSINKTTVIASRPASTSKTTTVASRPISTSKTSSVVSRPTSTSKTTTVSSRPSSTSKSTIVASRTTSNNKSTPVATRPSTTSTVRFFDSSIPKSEGQYIPPQGIAEMHDPAASTSPDAWEKAVIHSKMSLADVEEKARQQVKMLQKASERGQKAQKKASLEKQLQSLKNELMADEESSFQLGSGKQTALLGLSDKSSSSGSLEQKTKQSAAIPDTEFLEMSSDFSANDTDAEIEISPRTSKLITVPVKKPSSLGSGKQITVQSKKSSSSSQEDSLERRMKKEAAEQDNQFLKMSSDFSADDTDLEIQLFPRTSKLKLINVPLKKPSALGSSKQIKVVSEKSSSSQEDSLEKKMKQFAAVQDTEFLEMSSDFSANDTDTETEIDISPRTSKLQLINVPVKKPSTLGSGKEIPVVTKKSSSSSQEERKMKRSATEQDNQFLKMSSDFSADDTETEAEISPVKNKQKKVVKKAPVKVKVTAKKERSTSKVEEQPSSISHAPPFMSKKQVSADSLRKSSEKVPDGPYTSTPDGKMKLKHSSNRFSSSSHPSKKDLILDHVISEFLLRKPSSIELMQISSSSSSDLKIDSSHSLTPNSITLSSGLSSFKSPQTSGGTPTSSFPTDSSGHKSKSSYSKSRSGTWNTILEERTLIDDSSITEGDPTESSGSRHEVSHRKGSSTSSTIAEANIKTYFPSPSSDSQNSQNGHENNKSMRRSVTGVDVLDGSSSISTGGETTSNGSLIAKLGALSEHQVMQTFKDELDKLINDDEDRGSEPKSNGSPISDPTRDTNGSLDDGEPIDISAELRALHARHSEVQIPAPPSPEDESQNSESVDKEVRRINEFIGDLSDCGDLWDSPPLHGSKSHDEIVASIFEQLRDDFSGILPIDRPPW